MESHQITMFDHHVLPGCLRNHHERYGPRQLRMPRSGAKNTVQVVEMMKIDEDSSGCVLEIYSHSMGFYSDLREFIVI